MIYYMFDIYCPSSYQARSSLSTDSKEGLAQRVVRGVEFVMGYTIVVFCWGGVGMTFLLLESLLGG
jgi:hypothetical protein